MCPSCAVQAGGLTEQKVNASMQIFDAAVVGTGGIGSAALFHLAKRGLNVIGIDQFPAAHSLGSSHGQTRIIRQAYFEHPSYVPLLRRAYELWAELETQTQQQLFAQTGILEVGPPDGVLIQGIEASAEQHDLPIEKLTAKQVQERYPMFQIPSGNRAIFEPTAGMLFVEKCVAAHLQVAEQAGAEIRSDQEVIAIEVNENPIRIRTRTDEILAHRCVVCSGAWAQQLLPLPDTIRVVRKHLHWFASDEPGWQAKNNCPTFLYELPEGHFYGFPAINELGVKVAEHTGGEMVGNPSRLSKTPDSTDNERVETFTRQHLHGVTLQRTHHDVCMYTLSEDTHFIVDQHPDNPQIAFAAGMSGHGFKFATVLGEALSQLVLDGKTQWSVDFLKMSRLNA